MHDNLMLHVLTPAMVAAFLMDSGKTPFGTPFLPSRVHEWDPAQRAVTVWETPRVGALYGLLNEADRPIGWAAVESIELLRGGVSVAPLDVVRRLYPYGPSVPQDYVTAFPPEAFDPNETVRLVVQQGGERYEVTVPVSLLQRIREDFRIYDRAFDATQPN